MLTSSLGLEKVLVDYSSRHRFIFRMLMANDPSYAMDGNIGGRAHHFRRHIHGELDAAANLWQVGSHEQQPVGRNVFGGGLDRSEEHTSELQSLRHLVCRLLLEK